MNEEIDLNNDTAPKLAIEQRIVRYGDLRPCLNAFIDTRTPGSETKENFTIIGPGVSENPDQHVHISEPHGFNIGGARQPPHCTNSQHSHDTAEVFVVHSGEWRFDFGEHGEDAQLHASAGDIVSFPIHAFRGFTNVGPDTGFLWSVLGGDDPGRVTWAPRVFELARDYGLVLMENGSLVDRAAGQTLPEGVAPMPATSAEQVAAMRRMTAADAAGLVLRAGEGSERNLAPGVAAVAVIGRAGRMDWPHGFRVDRLAFEGGGAIDTETVERPEVVFVQSGTIEAVIDGESAVLAGGDTITFPVGRSRALRSEGGAVVFRVLGGDAE